MKIKQGQFLISAPDLKSCLSLNMPEIALIGRSNVGKSTFINALVNNNKLAKTSNTPGKTRLINLFQITTDSKPFAIADLPGYGYAKVSKTEQARWQKSLEEYLLNRVDLRFCIQFIDARHDIQKNDFQMFDWLKLNGIETLTILAKADYISKNEVSQKISDIQKHFKTEALPFSIKNNFYREQVLKFLSNAF